jgi:hypothetical protein
VDPRGEETLIVIGGGISSNPFGHASIAVDGSGIYSIGTRDPFGGNVVEFLKDQSTYRSSTAYILNTSPTQEHAILEYLLAKSRNTGGYDLIDNNCATMVMDAMESGEIPNALVQSYAAAGVLDYPYYTPQNAALIAASQHGVRIISLPKGTSNFSDFTRFNQR